MSKRKDWDKLSILNDIDIISGDVKFVHQRAVLILDDLIKLRQHVAAADFISSKPKVKRPSDQ